MVGQPTGVALGLGNGVGVVAGRELKGFAVVNDNVLRLAVAAGAAAAGLGFDQEYAASTDGYMVNVPIAVAGEIVKCAKAGIRDFVQHFGNGLFAAQAESDILRFLEMAKGPQRDPHTCKRGYHQNGNSRSEP